MTDGAEPARTGNRTGRRTWRSLLVPAILVFALLIGLGTWQLQRKAWKEGLIAALTTQLAAPPSALPAASTWPSVDESAQQYRRVTFTAQFDNANEALVIPAGLAFARVRKLQPELNLYAPDKRHPSPAGTYLAACVTLGALTGRSPVGNTYTMGLDPETARFLQQAAWDTVQQYYAQ